MVVGAEVAGIKPPTVDLCSSSVPGCSSIGVQDGNGGGFAWLRLALTKLTSEVDVKLAAAARMCYVGFVLKVGRGPTEVLLNVAGLMTPS